MSTAPEAAAPQPATAPAPGRIAITLALLAAFLQLPVSIGWLYNLATAAAGPVFSVTVELNNIETRKNDLLGSSFGSVVSMSVKNDGDRPAEGVMIRFPDTGDYEFSLDDQEKVGKFSNQFEVGQVKNGSVLNCKIWTTRRIDPAKENIRITHTTGDEY